MARVSLIPLAVDGLVAGMRGVSGFRAPTGPAGGVTVYDGPEWLVYEVADTDGMLIIGYGGEASDLRDNGSAPGESVTSTTGFTVLAPQTAARVRDNDFELDCAALYASGDIDPKVPRDAVFAIVDAVDTWLRSNPFFGVATQADGSQFVGPTVVTPSGLTQWLDEGARAILRFTISARTRV